MQKRIWASIVLAACLAGAAKAEPMTLNGTIGAKPVFFEISRNGDTLSGWYYYLKVGQQIRLDGKIDQHGFFDVQTYSASTNGRIGALTGRLKDGHWSGQWKAAAGRPTRALGLDPLKDNLKRADGHYRCTARRSDGDVTVSHSMDLRLAKGRVQLLTLSRNQSSGDEAPQHCALASRDLKQMSTRNGILMRARRDGAHCTLHMLGAGDYLLLRPGLATQAGDDCRGTGNKAFCTNGAFWSDLIVNRKTGRCVSVE